MPVDKDKTVRTSVIVPRDLYQQVQDLAARHDLSAAWIMRHALQEFLAAHVDDRVLPLKRGRSLRRAPPRGFAGITGINSRRGREGMAIAYRTRRYVQVGLLPAGAAA